MAVHRLRLIDDRVADLKAMCKALTVFVRQCGAVAAKGDCPIIQALAAD